MHTSTAIATAVHPSPTATATVYPAPAAPTGMIDPAPATTTPAVDPTAGAGLGRRRKPGAPKERRRNCRTGPFPHAPEKVLLQ